MQSVKVCSAPVFEYSVNAILLGWHLPGFDDSKWNQGKPTDGISEAGVAFYRFDEYYIFTRGFSWLETRNRTAFDLNIPHGVDYPLAFVFTNSTVNPHFRARVSADMTAGVRYSHNFSST